MNVDFFSDPFESRVNPIQLRIDFALEVGRPVHHGSIYSPLFDMNWRKDLHKKVEAQLLRLALKRCKSEKQKTRILINHLITHR